MPDLGYTSAGLRAGAQAHQDAGTEAGEMASVLAAAVVPAGAFGQVTAAAGFAAALDVAREGQGRAASAEATARADLATRARSTADQGDGLTAGTAATARGGAPGAITRAMAR